jgi:aryl-alcohol dehydrogenase-like predicted oxidoreductase
VIPTFPFGRTGHDSSRTLLGGAAFSNVSQTEADTILDLAFSRGVNHVDTAASYGVSEERLGDWIKRHGKRFFLATKTTERTKRKAKAELQQSLERLHVDQVDLLQLHNLVDPEEWEMALGSGGALEAALELRQQGLVRFIGVTGHGLTVARMHRQALDRFDFDSVLLPYNFVMAQDPQYPTEFTQLASVCRARHVAVQTIKTISRGPWEDRPRRYVTWYEPLEEQPEIDLAVHWVLGHEGLFLNTVGDIHLLPKVLDAANRFVARPADDQMKDQMERLGTKPLFR